MESLNKVLCLIVFFAFSLSCSNDGEKANNNTPACRYLIDTLSIDNPVLAIYEDALFIMPRDSVLYFASNPSHYNDNPGQRIFRILPHNIRMDIFDDEWNEVRNNSDFTNRAIEHIEMASSARCGLYSPICFSYSERAVYEYKVGCVEFYSFNPQPNKFLLELVYYDPQRYKENPYGHWTFITEESIESTYYKNKLDSLECVPVVPEWIEEPNYLFTLEPLYSREAINDYIKKNTANQIVRFGIHNRHIFIDLTPKYFTRRYVKKHCFPDL